MSVRVEHGDMLDVLARMVTAGERVQSIVTDPPYHLTSIVKRFGNTSKADDTLTSDRARRGADGMARLSRGFMGQQWDGGDIAFRPETWRLCYDLLPPGGHLLAFSSTRTYHRMACAIEDAGFEIRDMVAWLYGSGFPKSLDVSKAIDKAAGAERDRVPPRSVIGHQRNIGNRRPYMDDPNHTTVSDDPVTDAARQWQGWGTALKPALEPICLARKPLVGAVAANVQAHGTGALNIDGCRIGTDAGWSYPNGRGGQGWHGRKSLGGNLNEPIAASAGRWPANVCHDGSDEVVSTFPGEAGAFAPVRGSEPSRPAKNVYGEFGRGGGVFHADSGSAARFFYSAKADAEDRLGSKHPTVKPVDLMRWLVRLITPPGGVVLDPFAGSGTTGMACMAEGFDCILVEREAEYVADIRRRLAHVRGEDTPLFANKQEATF